MQVALAPAEKSASDAPACAPGTKAATPAPGRWLWVPDDDSPAVDGGAAASSSGGAVRAPKVEATPSLEGAAGTSRPPFISRIGVDAVASVSEGQVDDEPHQFHCSTGIMVPGGEGSEPYMGGTVRAVVLADGRPVPIERQTFSLMAAIVTPWGPVSIRLALAVMPGEDDLFSLAPKTLREELSIDVMEELRDTAAVSGAVRVSRNMLLPRCWLCRLRSLACVVWQSRWKQCNWLMTSRWRLL